MSELRAIARLKIHHGKLEEFKRLAVKCMESVRTRDSGTLQYDWFFSDDHSECVVHERYRDSAALLEHGANLGRDLRDPRPELMKALEGFDVRIYSPY